jgi:hypothetical protein
VRMLGGPDSAVTGHGSNARCQQGNALHSQRTCVFRSAVSPRDAQSGEARGAKVERPTAPFSHLGRHLEHDHVIAEHSPVIAADGPWPACVKLARGWPGSAGSGQVGLVVLGAVRSLALLMRGCGCLAV